MSTGSCRRDGRQCLGLHPQDLDGIVGHRTQRRGLWGAKHIAQWFLQWGVSLRYNLGDQLFRGGVECSSRGLGTCK